MKPDLQQEFVALTQAARTRLKAVPQLVGYERLFSFWEFPSFAPSSCWTVYAHCSFAHATTPFAEYTVWRSDIDLEKLRTPVERLKHPKDLRPTIESESVQLSDAALQAIEFAIRDVAVPFFVRGPSVVGLDGTRFEFQYSRTCLLASLEWRENHPEEWRPFTDALFAVIEDLEGQRKRRLSSSAVTRPPHA
jgi:hypothetical protein